jgi:DnaJ domain
MVEDPYAVLGVGTDASAEAVRQAYRSKARTCHPDVTREPHAAARFQRLAAAYEILGDPERRRAYDARRLARATGASRDPHRSGPVAVHRAPGPTGAVVSPPRAADVWAHATTAGPPPTTGERAASTDEWRLLSFLGRLAAAAALLVIVGITVIALLTAVRDDPPPAPAQFCRTPGGWIDCRKILDPLTP